MYAFIKYFISVTVTGAFKWHLCILVWLKDFAGSYIVYLSLSANLVLFLGSQEYIDFLRLRAINNTVKDTLIGFTGKYIILFQTNKLIKWKISFS